MIDLITAGKVGEFNKSLTFASVVVVVTALAYFCNALLQKKFKYPSRKIYAMIYIPALCAKATPASKRKTQRNC